MTTPRVAAVQASYVPTNRDATIDRVAELTAAAARQGAQLVVFPEVYVPGTTLLDAPEECRADGSGHPAEPPPRSVSSSTATAR